MQRISSEFAGFVRDTGVRAFDLLSERLNEVPVLLRPVLRAWSKLSTAQKNELFEQLIAVVRGGDSPPLTRKKAAKKR
ncbi:MAG TPA: hypothetical protein VGK31_12465 [Thermoanaerobaculia bacterium]|jgi:hypothetical protein